MDIENNFQELIRRGDDYYQNHEYDLAMECFERAVSSKSHDLEMVSRAIVDTKIDV